MPNVTYVPHVGKSLTADAPENNVVVDVKEIKLLSNDGANDITFNFENGVASDNAFVLKAGERIEEWNIPVRTIYYNAIGGVTAFRFIGTKA